jgi:hypothetical protein
MIRRPPGPPGRPSADVGGAGRPARGPGGGRGRVRDERRQGQARRLLADPAAGVVVAGHRGRLGRVNTGLARAVLAAHGRRLVVLDDGEVTDDLVRDMIEVLTSLCARLYGYRSARNRAGKAVGCARWDIGPQAVLAAGSAWCGGAG